MKKSSKYSAFFEPRVFISFLLVFGAVLLVFGAMGVSPTTTANAQTAQQPQTQSQPQSPASPSLLTPEEAQQMAAGITQLVSQSTEGLVQMQHPDGSVSMDLQGRFQNVVLAKKGTDGALEKACVDNVDTAAAFLQIDPQLVGGRARTPKSPPLPDKLEIR